MDGSTDRAPALSGHPVSRGRPALSKALPWAAACGVAVLVLAAYSNAASNRFIGIDTIQNVELNRDIQSLHPLWEAMSLHRGGADRVDDNSTLVRRPVLSLSFALNYAFLGAEARGFQHVNVLIHLLAALALFGVVRHTGTSFLRYTDGHATVLAFGVAACWGAHPLTTESVTNIVQRAESLMGLFAFLAFYCAIRGWRAADEGASRLASRLWRMGAVLSCLLGMGTKEVMVTVPPLVLLYDATFRSSGFVSALRRSRGLYLGFALCWLVPIVVVYATAANSARELDPARMVPYYLSQPRVVLHYLQRALWPTPLYHHLIGRPFWFQPGVSSWWEFVGQAVPVATLAVFSLVAAARTLPAGFLGAAFFVPLLPTSLLATFTLVQDHRVYLSLAAVISAVAFGLDACLRRAVPTHRVKVRGLVIVALIEAIVFASTATALAYQTRVRNQEYRSEATVWAPDDLMVAFAMLTAIAISRGDFGRGAEQLEELLTAADANPALPVDRAKVLNAIGVLRVMAGDAVVGEQRLRRALEAAPDDCLADGNLAIVSFERGTLDDALARAGAARCRSASKVSPWNYGMLLALAGRATEADEAFERAAPELDAGDVRARLREKGRLDRAAVRLSLLAGPPGEALREEEFPFDLRLVLVSDG